MKIHHNINSMWQIKFNGRNNTFYAITVLFQILLLPDFKYIFHCSFLVCLRFCFVGLLFFFCLVGILKKYLYFAIYLLSSYSFLLIPDLCQQCYLSYSSPIRKKTEENKAMQYHLQKMEEKNVLKKSACSP